MTEAQSITAPESEPTPETSAAVEPTPEASAPVEPKTPAPPPPSPKSYRLITRLEEREVTGRTEAVTTAKALSMEGGQTVLVERVDGKVKMSFRDGGLIDYVYETRKGRSV